MKKNRREKKGIYVYVPLLLMMLSGGTSFVWGQPQVVGGDSDIVEKTYANGIHICGSRIHDRIAEGNRVVLTNRGDVHYVYGGKVDEGTAQGNIVDLSSMTVEEIYGGKTFDNGAAIGNRVILNGIRVREIYGGWIGSGRPDVDVNGRVEGNEITATDTVVSFRHQHWSTVRATEGDICGGKLCGRGMVAGNRVILNNVTSENHGTVVGGWVYSGAAVGNRVEINRGKFRRMICGGGIGSEGTAQENIVILNHVAVGEDFSSHTPVYGGICKSGAATRNRVTLIGEHVTGSVYGGHVSGIGGNATDNEVNIEGYVVIGGTLYGGHIQGEYFSSSSIDNVTITVTDPDSGRTFHNVRPPSECIERERRGFRVRIGDAFTGNTLNLRHSLSLAEEIRNFEEMNFFINQDEFRIGIPCLKLRTRQVTDLRRVRIRLTVKITDENTLNDLIGTKKNLMCSEGKFQNFNPSSFIFSIEGNIDRDSPIPPRPRPRVKLSLRDWGKALVAEVVGALVLPEQPESGLLDRRPLLQTETDPNHCCNVM